ncbi:2-keto-3-deoxygluconate permease [Haloimpatiens sp. FM7315]|uniref:2-keto-3-deoxygluconate permease n=1 Tax=Haloimpatiens sp. FM7315 TaxID=3298609 RepID=UPI0035A296E2
MNENKFKLKYKRFPGDTIVVPMLIGVILNSFVPQALKIGGFFTSAVTGTGALVGIFLFFLGASINIKSTPESIKKGSVVIITKIAVSVILGLGVAFFFKDNFLGLSSLAIISGISVANNALFSGITAEYGNDSDKGAVGITSLSVGPTVTMIALSSAGLASISIWPIIGSILPLILGMILGNSNKWLKKNLSAGITPSIIVVGFALGCGMSFQQLFKGGLSGILLGLITVFVVGFITVLADKLTGGSGVAGAAISSTAASAVANPSALASVDPAFALIAPVATAQVAASVIITAFLTPLLTSYVAKKNKKDALENKAA